MEDGWMDTYMRFGSFFGCDSEIDFQSTKSANVT